MPSVLLFSLGGVCYSGPRFINLGFTVESGASLVFDMPETLFGPGEASVIK